MSLHETGCAERVMGERDFLRFRALIHRRTGIWLRSGKQVMLASRLSRMLGAVGVQSFAEYLARLETLPERSDEMTAFINCITTNKTSFYRESHHFDYLTRTLVPEMRQAASKGGARALRIWSAACSTGEEPYSIAIALLEGLGDAASSWDVRVFASDVDTNALQVAQEGLYDEACLMPMEETIRKKYFLRGTAGMSGFVKIKPQVARLVSFERINLMDASWPVDGMFDGIFFRNALIYFQQDIQDVFLRRMLRNLKPDGLLFLGHSEHVPWLYDVVSPLKQTVFRHKRKESFAH